MALAFALSLMICGAVILAACIIALGHGVMRPLDADDAEVDARDI